MRSNFSHVLALRHLGERCPQSLGRPLLNRHLQPASPYLFYEPESYRWPTVTARFLSEFPRTWKDKDEGERGEGERDGDARSRSTLATACNRTHVANQDECLSAPPGTHRLYIANTRAKALVTFLETRDRIPGKRALDVMTGYLRSEDGWSLPWMLFQLLVRHHHHQAAALLSPHLVPAHKWRLYLERRQETGVHVDSMMAWVWILDPSSWDERVSRFLRTKTHRPLFLLFLLTHANSRLHAPDNVVGLVSYITETYCRTGSPSISPTFFLELTRRLALHVRRVDPVYQVQLARAAVDYIKLMPPSEHDDKVFATKTRIVNSLLDEFSTPSPEWPLRTRRANWDAQRVLLALSSESTRPLLLSRVGLLSIRKVFIGLGKSRGEINAALKAKSTWPAYRKPRDGMEEKMGPEELVSRAVAAGSAAREAGYADFDYDRALDILGGGSPGSPPSIQMRSLPPPDSVVERRGRRLSGDFSSPLRTQTPSTISRQVAWGARVKATRNAAEAWTEFQRSEEQDERPGPTVYAQMFKKLVAVDANTLILEPDILPGDHPGLVFPISFPNMSEYERVRTRPPTIPELFDRMRESDVTPNLDCIVTLVHSAESFDEAFRYLEDSGSVLLHQDFLRVHHAIFEALRTKGKPLCDFSLVNHAHVRSIAKVPSALFTALIRLACRLQASYLRGFCRGDVQTRPSLGYIRVAVQLIRLRQGFNRRGTTETGQCWRMVLKQISRGETVVTSDPNPHPTVASLHLMVRTWSIYVAGHGVDPRTFSYLAKAVENVGIAMLRHEPLYQAKGVIWRSCRMLKHAFLQLSRSLRRVQRTAPGTVTVQGVPGPNAIHSYVRAMGLVGGHEVQMLWALKWMLESMTAVRGFEAKFSFHQEKAVQQTFCAFRAFAEGALPRLASIHRQTVSKLEQMTSTHDQLSWPGDAEVEAYTRADISGANTTRLEEIRHSTSYWMQVKNSPGRKYVARHQPLGDAIRQIVQWKAEIRKDEMSKRKEVKRDRRGRQADGEAVFKKLGLGVAKS